MSNSIETESIDFKDTGKFSRIIIDYIEQAADLREFYHHPVSLEGIKEAIKERRKFNTDRPLLVSQLQKQYSRVTVSAEVSDNIQALLADNTYTVCTAHQPNIFTGHLYFIYKILQIIKLAETLQQKLPGSRFVPVYYMGSEDADLEELGQINLFGQKYSWNTSQTGAVGRMKVDDELLSLVNSISGQLSVLPFGIPLIELLKSCYLKGSTIEEATFRLVHALFGKYGLIVFLPDNPEYKRKLIPVFTDDLTRQHPSAIVTKTVALLSKTYSVQANAREINLFYLADGIRNRIVKQTGKYVVLETPLSFSEEELAAELAAHPERFSPNVILRGLLQETILPNISFIGGGGEIAYWLELKSLFENYHIPYPVLLVRNSFMYIEPGVAEIIRKINIPFPALFRNTHELLKDIIISRNPTGLSLAEDSEALKKAYQALGEKAKKTDPTLEDHVFALLAKSVHKIEELEKKMIRSEKAKYSATARQVSKVKNQLFPENNLQERVDNFMPFYAGHGDAFFEDIYKSIQPLDQKFMIIYKK